MHYTEWVEDLEDYGYNESWDNLSEEEQEEVWDSIAQSIKDDFPITINIETGQDE